MEIEKKREMGSQKLLLSYDEEKAGFREDFRERMMLENEIPEHIPFRIRRINGKKIYEYDIEGLSSLEEEAGKKLGFETVRALAHGLSDAVCAGAPFLLREDDYVISPETVFFDKKDKNMKLVYCPGYDRNLKNCLADLMEYCLDMIDYNDGLAVRSTYGLYMKLRDGCSLQQLKESVDEVAEEVKEENALSGDGTSGSSNTDEIMGKSEYTAPEKTRKQVASECSAEVIGITGESWRLNQGAKKQTQYRDEPKDHAKERSLGKIREIWELVDHKNKVVVLICVGACTALVIAVASGRIDAFSRRVAGIPVWIPLMAAVTAICILMIIKAVRPILQLVSDNNETEGAEDDKETILMIGKGTQESLILVSDTLPGLCTDKFPCVIGKDSGTCDLIVDAKGVSRRHMRIDRNQGGTVTIEDLNTMNGTFLNGRKLAPNISFEVREGDEISFGSASYYVNHLG